MKQTFRRAAALFMVLAILIPMGGALAAQPEVPMQTEVSAEQTEALHARATAVRQILQASAVAKPKASKAAGTYTSEVKVKLTTTTKSAKIYYTTDGSKPTTKSKVYKSTLSVKKNITLKAIAVKSGKSSAVLTVKYSVRAATPKANKKAGTYVDSVSVKLTTDTSGAKIYYTTDGSTPTNKSKQYSKTIKISKTTTIKAIALKSGMTKSKVVTAKYTISKASYTNRPGYLACTEDEKKVYEAIYEGMAAVEEEIYLTMRLPETTAMQVMMRVDSDNPELLAWTGSVWTSAEKNIDCIFPEYAFSKSKQTSMQKELKAAAEKIAEKARKQKTVADQIKVIHDEIILGACYNDAAADDPDKEESHNAYNADGVLVEKTGVCESYARAFQYVCQLLDIPAILVSGDVGGGHMWNMVQIDDTWYHIDLTWDDPEDGKSSYIDYDYFLISDKTIGKTHKVAPLVPFNVGLEGLYNYYTIPKAPKSYNLNTLSNAA